MRRAVLALISLPVAVAGCSSPAAPAAPSVGRPAASAADDASPAEASSAAIPAAPSAAAVPASATPTARASQATTAPQFQVKDVEQLSGFYSPSGGLMCSVGPQGAECLLSSGAEKQLEYRLDCGPLNGHSVVIRDVIDYGCHGDPWVFPTKGDDSAGWVEGFGTFIKGHTDTIAVLPYGKALRYAPYTCGMDTSGVTCTNEVTKVGFHMNRAGLTLDASGPASVRAAMTRTCRALATFREVDNTQISGIIADAATDAGVAAKQDATYRPLADDLALVHEIGIRYLSDADRAKTGPAWKRIKQECVALGVPNAGFAP